VISLREERSSQAFEKSADENLGSKKEDLSEQFRILIVKKGTELRY
jgi:hypothetical protein